MGDLGMNGYVENDVRYEVTEIKMGLHPHVIAANNTGCETERKAA